MYEVVLALDICNETVVPNAVKAAGKDVQQETTHELVGVKRHHLVASSSLGSIILPTESNATLIHGDESPIGDGDAVRIARQVS